MLRCHIRTDRGIRNDGSGGCPLGAADDINRKAVVIQVLYEFDHRQIEIVNVSHIDETGCLLLPELDSVVIEFLNGHAGICLCKVAGQCFIGDISRLDFRSDCLQFIRDPVRMIIQTVFDEHHCVVIRVIRLTCQCAIHIEYRDTIFDRNKVITVFIRNSRYIINQLLFRGRSFCPEGKDLGSIVRGWFGRCRGSPSAGCKHEADANQGNQLDNGGTAPEIQLLFCVVHVVFSFSFCTNFNIISRWAKTARPHIDKSNRTVPPASAAAKTGTPMTFHPDRNKTPLRMANSHYRKEPAADDA